MSFFKKYKSIFGENQSMFLAVETVSRKDRNDCFSGAVKLPCAALKKNAMT